MKQWHKVSLGILGAVVAGITLDALFLEKVLFKIKHFTLGDTDRHDSIRILHITDLHFRDRLSLKYRRLLNKINEIRPDIILISGDSIDEGGKTKDFEKFLRIICSNILVVGIPGNHEYKAEINMGKFRQLFKNAGGDLLINQTKVYRINGQRLAVTGMDDMINGNSDFERAVENTYGEHNHLVLIHSPKHFKIIKEKIKEINAKRTEKEKLDIYAFLAGHNHGGQIKFGPYVPVLPPDSGDYVQGWYNDQKPYLYLSKGFGTSSVPVRFFARAEITVFTYYTKGQGSLNE